MKDSFFSFFSLSPFVAFSCLLVCMYKRILATHRQTDRRMNILIISGGGGATGRKKLEEGKKGSWKIN